MKNNRIIVVVKINLIVNIPQNSHCVMSKLSNILHIMAYTYHNTVSKQYHTHYIK